MPRPNATRFRGTGLQNYKSNVHVGRDINISTARQDREREEAREDPIVKHRKELLRSLQFVQMDAREQNIKRAHAQTCQWFLETCQYQAWLDISRSREHGGFLWVKGKPGAGKSTLMKVVLQHTKQRLKNSGACILFFFFNARGSDLEKSTIGLHRALLVQLLKACPDAQEVLDNIRNDHIWGIESLKSIFEQALQSCKHQRLLCFIDALDECKEREIRALISWFEELSFEYSLHVCFASRHFPYISIRRSLQISLEAQEQHAQDISCYLSHHLYFEDDSSLAEQIRADLQAKASGIFIWIVLVVEMLNKEYDAGQKHSLREMIKKIPQDLHDLFRDILSRDAGPNQGVLLCLQWLLFTKRPLTPRELYLAILSGTEPQSLKTCHSEAISDHDVEKYILNNSKGLSEITKTSTPTVQFIHETVKDFLVEGNGLTTMWPSLQTNLAGQSHEALKRCCAQYRLALQVELRQILPREFIKRPSTEANKLRRILSTKYPFLEYANDGLLFHANQSQTYNIEQGSFLRQLCLESWNRLHGIFVLWNRGYIAGVSMLYVLADHNYSALIRASSLRSCFDMQGGPVGAPILVALAKRSYATVQSLVEVLVQDESPMSTTNDISMRSVSQDYDKIVNNKLSEKIDLSQSKCIASYLAELGCRGLLETYIRTQEYDIDREDEGGKIPLIYAMENGHIDVVQILIDGGANVNAVLENGWTPLLYSVENGYIDVAKLLIGGGADVNLCSKTGWTPLHAATSKDEHELVELLIHHAANVNAASLDGSTPLNPASSTSRLRVIKPLTEDSTSVREARSDGLIPLHDAVSGGHTDCVRPLLDHDSNAESRYDNGRAPLHLASLNGYTDIVKLLLDHGADADARDHNSETPSFQAILEGHTEIVQQLLKCGADPNARCNDGQTLLHSAAAHGQVDVVRSLLLHGAHVGIRQGRGETPLHKAAYYGYTDIIQLLLDFGADVHARRNDKSTPLHRAIMNQQWETAKLLSDRSAASDDFFSR
jgi:ankyrin repeat protein